MKTVMVSQSVKKVIDKIPPGKIFDYSFFSLSPDKEQALTKTLSRMYKNGELARVSKGKYYKPTETRFGQLRPKEEELINALTSNKKTQTGYLTGTALYNQMGLTSQISNDLLIAQNVVQPNKKLVGYNIRYTKRTVKIKKEYVPLLQLLDAFRDIKSIPDAPIDQSVKILGSKIAELSDKDIKTMINLSRDYNPATRALLGAVLNYYRPIIKTDTLLSSLNPLTKFKIGISDKVLGTKQKWNIV
ncbi:hypothetical protein GO495_17675 [Chitinophaga oryziterrae]|uniref:AbiEi antitoxin C-terminal domain-containing protein n=1 Tax=Chitinophaga oryziterrae TaxID=1031224 RepID=A0A6N8JB01_9BACT|nr:DUF6088 family protein [Chitinophaga oryziterrae]MVT42427.1 hypothetical protein [Chitinophaga oryziterrae]